MEFKSDRRCMECGAEIPLNTSETYDPNAVNPKFGQPNQGFYLELCMKCARIKNTGTIKVS